MSNESVCIIRMKLCRPIGTPVDEFWDAINECGRKCDIARNAMFRYWLRWREDNPDWSPDVLVDSDGNPKRLKSGDLIYANCPAPSLLSNEKPCEPGAICRWCRGENKSRAVIAREAPTGEYEPVCEKHRKVTFSTVLYRKGGEVVQDLSAAITATLSSEVWNKLRANAPFVPGNRSLYRWQAYLTNEANLDSCRSRAIPIAKTVLTLGWDDCCWVQFPLWGKGRDGNRTYKVECKVEGLPAGKKRILQKVISGELHALDSKLVSMKAANGADWELHLVVMLPNREPTLDKSRTLLIRACGADAYRPFIAELPDGTEIPIGRGIPVWKEYERLTLRRKAIRAGNRLGAMKGGHGMRRIMAKVTSESKRYGGVQSAFQRDLAEFVYRIAKGNNCGTIVYDEPTVATRDKLWFGSRNVPFNWTEQLNRFTSKFQRLGLAFSRLQEPKSRRKKKREEKTCST